MGGGRQIEVDHGLVDTILWSTELGLSQFLKKYGIPDEIWISNGTDYPLSIIEVEIVLLYRELGIMVTFRLYAENGSLLEFCPGDIDPVNWIWFFSPHENKTFEDVGEPWLFRRSPPYHPLVEITTENMSIDEFYELFVDPLANDCFIVQKP